MTSTRARGRAIYPRAEAPTDPALEDDEGVPLVGPGHHPRLGRGSTSVAARSWALPWNGPARAAAGCGTSAPQTPVTA